MIAVLLIILILVVLFREEIRALIGLSIVALLAYGFWNNEDIALWGKIAAVILFSLPLLAIITGILSAFISNKKSRMADEPYERRMKKILKYSPENRTKSAIRLENFKAYISFTSIFAAIIAGSIFLFTYFL